jgi:hypothetical protein
MTTAEHRQAAEDLLARIPNDAIANPDLHQVHANMIAAAQVHATLALRDRDPE